MLALLLAVATFSCDCLSASADEQCKEAVASPCGFLTKTAATPEPECEQSHVFEANEGLIQKGAVNVEVNTVAPVQFSQVASSLVEEAKNRSVDMQKCVTSMQHFSNSKANLGALASDALNSIFMFKGVSVASEAGDVILDEKLKVTGKGPALLAKQKLSDDLELSVITDLLEIAAGSGNADQVNGGKQVEETAADLSKLVGNDQAAKAVASTKAMCTPTQTLVDVEPSIKGTRRRCQNAVQTAMKRDPLVDEVTAEVHRFNTHSGSVLVAHRVARTALCVVSLAPNLAGPAAQAALFFSVVLSGGSEQSKVMKELYMDKRLQSRVSALAEEVHLVFESHKVGVLTNNVALTRCSEELLARLVGQDRARALLHDKNAIEALALIDAADSSATSIASAGRGVHEKTEPQVVVNVTGTGE
jgi:hypothetical protein